MTKSRVQINRSSVTRQRPVDRDPGELYVNFSDLQLGVANTSRVATDLVAVRFHSEDASYIEDEFVVYNGAIYRAVAPSLPGPFVTGNWQVVSSSVVYWDDVQSKPDTFPPTLPILQSDVIGLQDELTEKIEDAPSDGEQYARQNESWAVVTGVATDWADVTGKPATFPPTVPIAQADITGLVAAQTAQDTAIAGKAATVHTHAQSDVTGLTTDLALLAPKASPVFTGQVQAPAGTVGAPGLSFSTAPDMGIYATAGLNFAVGGAQKISIASSGASITATSYKFTLAASTATRSGLLLPHGAAPTTPADGDMWSTTASLNFRLNGATKSAAFLEGATFSGKVLVPAPVAGSCGLNIGAAGTAPTTPVDGDIWLSGSSLNYRYGGSTFTTLNIAGSQSATGQKTFTATTFFRAGTVGTSSINFIAGGAAPTTPNNGDVWATDANGLYMRVNGVSRHLSIFVGTTAPASPLTNDLWLDIN
jgi:hypothetical protein